MTEGVSLSSVRALLESRQRDGTTHYEGCEKEHIDCAAWWMLEQLEEQALIESYE